MRQFLDVFLGIDPMGDSIPFLLVELIEHPLVGKLAPHGLEIVET
jgi:hypothetical protein